MHFVPETLKTDVSLVTEDEQTFRVKLLQQKDKQRRIKGGKKSSLFKR